MLLGQNLGGRHQRALPARADGHRRGQRRHHRLAGADVALQQPVHGLRAGQVLRDLLDHAALRLGEPERQRGEQPLVQPLAFGAQRRRLQARALALGLQLRQLLGQQLLELEPQPGGVAAVLQRRERHPGRRMVQEVQRLAQRRQAGRHHLGRQHLGQVGTRQRRAHRLAQVGLRQLGRGRVDRRQRLGQRGVGRDRLEARVHHLAAEEAAAQLAARADALAHRERLLVRGVEAEEAQPHGVAAVVQRDDQLAARAQADLAVGHHALDLHRVAIARVGQPGDARLVLVAQRQVQRKVDVAHQAELLQRLLGRGLLALGGRGGIRGRRHGLHSARARRGRRVRDNRRFFHGNGSVRPSIRCNAPTP